MSGTTGRTTTTLGCARSRCLPIEVRYKIQDACACATAAVAITSLVVFQMVRPVANPSSQWPAEWWCWGTQLSIHACQDITWWTRQTGPASKEDTGQDIRRSADVSTLECLLPVSVQILHRSFPDLRLVTFCCHWHSSSCSYILCISAGAGTLRGGVAEPVHHLELRGYLLLQGWLHFPSRASADHPMLGHRPVGVCESDMRT